VLTLADRLLLLAFDLRLPRLAGFWVVSGELRFGAGVGCGTTIAF
jgi:hypothetical protein